MRDRRSLKANAHILDAQGKVQRSFPVGDAVAHTQVDDSGRIWIAYFDEGHGPLDDDSLNCFSSEGQVLRSFPELGILDCYTLNVFQNGAWLCYIPISLSSGLTRMEPCNAGPTR
jgi:hypothetical protein